MVWTVTADFSVEGLHEDINKALPEGTSLAHFFTMFSTPSAGGDMWCLTTKGNSSEDYQAYKTVDEVVKDKEASAFHRDVGVYLRAR